MSSPEIPQFPPLKKGDAVSKGWDDMGNAWLFCTSFEKTMTELGIPLLPEHHIVEIGAGNGTFSDILRKKGFQAIGVDIEKRGTPGADVIARVELMPFPDNSVDVVASTSVFDSAVYNQDQGKMLSEIARILKPGGVFYSISDGIEVPIPRPLERVQDGLTSVYKKRE